MERDASVASGEWWLLMGEMISYQGGEVTAADSQGTMPS